jgi:drug/metabolite transporter (DMT)-like permease
MQIVLKELKGVPVFQIVFFRGLIALLISSATLKYQSINPLKGTFRDPIVLLLLRGFFGTVSIFLFVHSVQNLHLATAASLQYLAPLFTVLFAGPLLREWPSPLILIAFAVSCCGVFLLNGMTSASLNSGVLIGVASAVSSGVSYNLIRKLQGKASPDVVVFWFSIVIVTLSAWNTFVPWVNPSPHNLFLLLLVGLLSHFGQIFLTRSYQMVAASQIAYFNYLGVIFAVVCGLVLYDEKLAPHALLGVFLILAGVVLANRLGREEKFSVSP